MPAPLNPPTLQRVEFDRVPARLGQMWKLRKGNRTMARTQACWRESEVSETADAWRFGAEAKGWHSQVIDPHS